MSIHPNLFRNDRDPKEEAFRLAGLYSGKTLSTANRTSILRSLEITSNSKQLPKADKDFWKQVIIELNKIPEELESPLKKNKSYTGVRSIIFIFSVIFLCCLPRIIQGLTPVEILTERLHENSKYTFNGSICNDGHISHSQGQGSCSWHGGVNSSFEKGDYSKSIEECRVEALKLSWRSQDNQ